ncbi:MAG: TolC family protein [Methylococcales bacterium]|nr:TolC family protein [Methylococcales bacterium]
MFLPFLIPLLLTPTFAHAENLPRVEHHDPMVVDSQLSLSQLVDSTLEKHPDNQWLTSLETEVNALKKRGESLTAGASSLQLSFQEGTNLALHYSNAIVQVPLWNLGQRDANQQIGINAETAAAMQAIETKLKIAGLVRIALWDVSLQSIRNEQAQSDLLATERLLNVVKRRVHLGDLPKSDELLAESELLQKKSAANLAEAELMHARKRYTIITQSTHIPSAYQERLASVKEIEQSHPVLQTVNSKIEQKQAELHALDLVGSGQTSVAVSFNSDRAPKNSTLSNQLEMVGVGVNIPFGGEAHLAPQRAALYVELNKLNAERDQIFRDLEQTHHEAEHTLQVNQAELSISNELKTVAEKHLKMTELSFSVGEIDLIDFIKIQTQTQLAVLTAKERAVIVQRDIALYNQAVGLLP